MESIYQFWWFCERILTICVWFECILFRMQLEIIIRWHRSLAVAFYVDNHLWHHFPSRMNCFWYGSLYPTVFLQCSSIYKLNFKKAKDQSFVLPIHTTWTSEYGERPAISIACSVVEIVSDECNFLYRPYWCWKESLLECAELPLVSRKNKNWRCLQLFCTSLYIVCNS